MANYLLIDDVEAQWDDYNNTWLQPWIQQMENKENLSPEERMFANLRPHSLNCCLQSFEEITENIQQALMSGDLDLIISDISLGGDENHMEADRWINQVLKNIIEGSPEIQEMLKSRGIGLILMTNHHREILGHFFNQNLAFFNKWFPGWGYINKYDFPSKFLEKFKEVSVNFLEFQGRWCHRNNKKTYSDRVIGQMHHDFEMRTPIRLRSEQIIAIIADSQSSEIIYTPNPRAKPIVAVKFTDDTFNRDDVMKKLDVRDLSGGIPEGFLCEEAYFLHIKDRPRIVINNSFSWKAEGANHGRNLTLDDAQYQDGQLVKAHSRFEWLNDYFKI